MLTHLQTCTHACIPQEVEPTPLSSFGVREVFCSGAFLRVSIEETRIVEERERAIEAARINADKKVKAMLQSPLPSQVRCLCALMDALDQSGAACLLSM